MQVRGSLFWSTTTWAWPAAGMGPMAHRLLCAHEYDVTLLLFFILLRFEGFSFWTWEISLSSSCPLVIGKFHGVNSSFPLSFVTGLSKPPQVTTTLTMIFMHLRHGLSGRPAKKITLHVCQLNNH
jgi:hypothetical protein